MVAVNATQAPPILHLSSVVGSPLRDSAGERLGKVEDVIVRLGGAGYPPITGFLVSVAGRTYEEFVSMTARLADVGQIAAIELNISCPNVSHGVDFGTDPAMCERVVAGARQDG